MASYNTDTTNLDLRTFLEGRIVEKGQPYTHTSMGKPFCSYYINNNELNTFFSLYEKSIMNGEELHIIEKHEEIGPLVIDFDFKFDENENGDRIHTEETVYEIVKLYVNEICETFDINKNSNKLHAFVFERPSAYIEKNIKKDGIHIIFPYIVSTPQVQYFIRDNILKKINPILENLPLRNLPSDIIDRSVIYSNGWMLFGSHKPKKDSYQISYIFDGNMNKMEINEYPFTMNIARFFSIREKKDKDLTIIREDKIPFIEKSNKVKIVKSKIKKPVSYDLEQIKEMLSILSDERVDNYHTWIEVGWALHNIDSSSQELLDLWIEFSMRSPKFKEGVCEKEWEKSKNDGLGIGSLFHWAKTDNFAKYKIIMNKYVQNYVEKSVKSPTNFDIATVLFHMYKYEYKYTGSEWYMFRNHLWHKENDGMYLRQKISTDLLEKYILLMSDYNKICSSTDQNITEDDREEYKTKNKEITKICLNLKTTAFKDNIVKECKELFYDKNFANNLDTNFYLLGFNNGIYELKTGILRDGRPDDYVSMSTNIDKIDFDPDHEFWNDIKKFIDTVFFDEEVREYFLLFLASCLQGHNAEEKFRIWTGSGCHALDTDILMYDGSIKKVQDIIVGDKIMGDDSSPRNVLELKRGFSDMYEFSTIKGEKFTVNGDHVLCLKATTITTYTFSEKENRFKLRWQEKDINGLPFIKCKNFPFKYDGKKLYKKSVTYYENKDDAEKACILFKENLINNENDIKKGDIIEIKVNDFLKIRNIINPRNYYLYKNNIDFDEKELPLDPYIVGYWLGDGTSQISGITTMDKEIVDYFEQKSEEFDLNVKKYSKENGLASTYIYSSKNKGVNNKKYNNIFYETLKNENMINNKHIPDKYKFNSRQNRLNLLAGIIDSDGHYQKNNKQYEITLKSEKLIDDILYISRSLGFSCTKREVEKSCKDFTGKYFNLIIYGENIYEIPVLLERKKAEMRIKNKDSSVYSFTINRVKDDNFYGFELDGNHRYLMGNFIVTHNSNGKSKIMELLCHSLGDYTIKFHVTMLTGKRAASNAATPEIVMAKGKRFGYFEEPSGNERINAGLLKEFSGGDKITARGLHKDPIEFKPQFKLSLLCNDIPEVPAHDTGISRRLEIIEFKSKFTEHPKEMNEFHIDKSLSDKLPLWKELFIAYLLDVYYDKYKNGGIKVPAEVVKFTVEFQKQCDSYDDFISSFLEETKENNDIIGINEIYDEFRIWYEDSFGNNKYPSKMEFGKYLKKKYPKNYVGKELKRFRKKGKNSIILNPNPSVSVNGSVNASINANINASVNANINADANVISTENKIQSGEQPVVVVSANTPGY